MNVRRLHENSELGRIRGKGGYVLNITGSRPRIHRANCVTVGWMNLGKRGGVYYAATLEEALEWLETKAMRGAPCKLCLPTLTYKPRPEDLLVRLRRTKA